MIAGFTASSPGGCAPFAASFINTTSGASSRAVYEWDFGNGNHSFLKDAGAVFQDEKSFTVALTVKDSGKTAIHSQTVTVYKKPVVDFSASRQKGCAPFPVTFNSTTVAGDGSVTDYFWDFGNGATGQGNTPQITHTYLTGQKPSITLAVTNSYGCTNHTILHNLLEVYPGVKADFNATDSFVCFATDPVHLINNSTGTGNLLYAWDFGNGISSTQKDPVHTFNIKGSYSVSLAVKNSFGCTDTLAKSAYLNVGNFKSEISVPAIICDGSIAELKNTSFPAPSAFSWLADGTDSVTADQYGLFKHQFITAGNHTIQLTNRFGNCTEIITKIVDVKPLLQPKGFIADIPAHCAQHVTVAFHDTTSGAVKTEWNFERLYSPWPVQATGKDASYTYTQHNHWIVTLFVTDANGCTNSVEQVVPILYPQVSIVALDSNGLVGCMSLTKKFGIVTGEPLGSFSWDFGNGNVSTAAEPTFTFGVGQHVVRLKYTTAKGCTGDSYLYLQVFPTPKAEFVSLSGTTICGNSIVWFETPQVNYWDYWEFDGEYSSGTYYTRKDFQFKDTGLHTVTLVVYNDGCRDTLTKKDFIRVLPSFPKISSVKNTCDGDRGTVTFIQTSRYAQQWIWDFGDGSAPVIFNTDQGTVTHHYQITGKYKVVLSTVSGQCTVKDSVYAYVQLKQNPVLSSAKTTVCMDEGLTYSLTNIEPLSYDGIWVWAQVERYEYNDGAGFNVDINEWDNWVHTNPYTTTFKNLVKGKSEIRIITTQPYFYCADTSNFIPIKVQGAAAGFQFISNNVCYGNPVIFKDTSNGFNTNIVKREWNFGDGLSQTTTQGGIVSHTYAAPGNYTVTLKITDDGGCSSTTSTANQQAIVNGPKAAFSASALNVQLNGTVQFVNTSDTYNSYPTEYNWQFGDGASSTDYSPAHTFTRAGIYKVLQIAKNTSTGCTDTAFEIITVKDFQTGFTHQQSFILNGKCPPILYQFNNTSLNYTSVKWDFGDGTVAENTDHPNHLYTVPGVYVVSLFITGNNGLSDIFKDTITVAQQKLQLTADLLHGCTTQSITLSTTNKKAAAYVWDFGDGSVVSGSDSFALHPYQQPGIYSPKLIMADSLGCETSINLGDKIVIDSLFVSLSNLPQNICTPKSVVFDPVIVNIAADQAQQILVYHWDFGTGNKADTANVKKPSFTYLQAGNYPVSLKVQSPYGCIKEVKSNITALQGLGAQITGPAQICQETNALFSGTTLLQGQPSWKWIFDDGAIVQQQNPPAKMYRDTGNFLVKLIVDNGGCADTVARSIRVNQKPIVGLSLKQFSLCEGSQVTITATGGIKYSWSPISGLNNPVNPSIIAGPLSNTTYTVSVTNSFGCMHTDSVIITVVHPFRLQVLPATAICSGESALLQASGAARYQWTRDVAGLSSTIIPNPVARPVTTTTYTVTGIDASQCFTDTATVKVTVLPLPTVDAGQPAIVVAGSAHQLQPSFSTDVVKWLWTPATYLSCSGCAAPVASPTAPVTYSLTVTNAAGCKATDTVSINLLCSESRVYIPSVFSPNNDGKNDRFAIKGQGIQMVNHFIIYNRYGQKIFEQANFKIGDLNATWDGMFKGAPVPPGAYIYFAEMSCDAKTFTKKGTVTVVY